MCGCIVTLWKVYRVLKPGPTIHGWPHLVQNSIPLCISRDMWPRDTKLAVYMRRTPNVCSIPKVGHHELLFTLDNIWSKIPFWKVMSTKSKSHRSISHILFDLGSLKTLFQPMKLILLLNLIMCQNDFGGYVIIHVILGSVINLVWLMAFSLTPFWIFVNNWEHTIS